MQVAVARVEDVGDFQIVLGANLADARQRVRKLRERDRSVHAKIIGYAPDGAEGGLAPGPDARALLGSGTHDDGFRIVCRRDLGDAAEQNADLVFRAFDLDDQQGFNIERITGSGESFADFDRGSVHVFDRHRNDAGRDDRGNATARSFRRAETDHQRARAFGGRKDFNSRFGDDAELAFRADHEAQEIVAVAFERGAADVDDRAVDQHHLDAQHVVGRHAVFEAMRAAGIHREIAGDGAGELRRRIGRVEETFRRHARGDFEIGDAGFDAREAIDVVDLDHAIHFRNAKDDGVLGRQRAAAKRRASAARNDLDVVLVAELQDLRNVFGRARQHDEHRDVAICGEGVGLVSAASVLVENEKVRADAGFQIFDQNRAATDHAGIRFRQLDMWHRQTSPQRPPRNRPCATQP